MTTLERIREVRYFEDKMRFTLGPVELSNMISDGKRIVIVDVRDGDAYRKSHVPGAIHMPREKWDTLEGLSKKELNVIYCYSQQCHAAPDACLRFARNGYRVMELEGGWKAWEEYGLSVETEERRKAA